MHPSSSPQLQSKEDLELLAGILDGLGEIPAVHVVGNHDLAFVAKDYWLTKLRTPLTGWGTDLDLDPDPDLDG